MLEDVIVWFRYVVEYAILGLEAIGVILILVAGVRALIHLFTDKEQSKRDMYDGITTALTFLLGSEVMRTIIAPGWADIGMTCAILVMRARIVLLVHWENSQEHGGEKAKALSAGEEDKEESHNKETET